jgi:hypothetical protein
MPNYIDTLADLLRKGSDTLVNLPSEAQRFMTNPQAFTQAVTGKNPMPRETGFAAGATGLQPTEMSVLDPNQAAYMQGYSQGEPIGYAGMAAPLAAPATVATAKALAPKAGQMAENYMARQGMMPSIVPSSPKTAAFVPEKMSPAYEDIAKTYFPSAPQSSLDDVLRRELTGWINGAGDIPTKKGFQEYLKDVYAKDTLGPDSIPLKDGLKRLNELVKNKTIMFKPSRKELLEKKVNELKE